MTDVVVHRCELRIRRTSGWSWGATPDELIAAATRAIPRLLAAKLPELAVPAGETIVIDRPIVVKLTATARQLAALGDGATPAPEIAALRAKIEAEVAAAVAQAVARDGVSAAAPPAIAYEPGASRATPNAENAELAADEAPRRAARAWWRSGTIDAVLARLEPAALVRLCWLLLGDEPSDAEPAEELVATFARLAQRYTTAPAPGLDGMRRRVALAAGVIDVLPRIAQPQLRALLDRYVPIEATAPVAERSARTESVGGDTTGDVRARDRATVLARVDAPVRELEIRSALPFLLLASLHHAGWLESAAGLLALHDCEADAFALAAGLAATVLDPLERGWSRPAADRLALAVFCGRSQPILDAEIAAAANRLQPIFAPLDASLRGVLARARRPVPLALWRDDRGWYLIDLDGTVVLAAGEVLPDVLLAAPPALVIVPERCAQPATLEQLDYANLEFVTPAPPGRGEMLRSFAGTGGRLYTNDTATPAGKLAALTAHLDHALALVEEVIEVLSERPAVPRDPSTAFAATCQLAATAALADLGTRLFPAESTTPVLALTRFRDLDARVWFEQDRVRVRVPLGRRHAELMHHGVLGELAVPWLPGRMIDLGGG
ncbi:MAG TPA: hypothetical protein VIV58_05260 [Kofleriaceae bacterium]